jgi:LysM repeat protein
MPTEPPTVAPDAVSASHALIVQGTALPAPRAEADVPMVLEEATAETEICIIPGSGVPELPPVAPLRRRAGRLHVGIAALGLCGVLAMLLSFAPITVAAGGHVNPFSALAQAMLLPTPRPYFTYRVQPGDTFESIAMHFHVQTMGIYALNHLYAGQEAQEGQVIRVPTNPQYGATYVPPPLPVMSAGAGIGAANYYGTCLFCSAGGWTNGSDQPCAPGMQTLPANPANAALINPNPNSTWVRGFTWYHNGVDITSGFGATPILAAQAGVVIFAGWDPYGAGYAIKINHCGGLATAYGHLSKLLVALGEPVRAGQTIGLQGATGMATGPHLHFMTWWDNVPFDPLCIYPSLDGVSATAHYGGCPAPQSAP